MGNAFWGCFFGREERVLFKEEVVERVGGDKIYAIEDKGYSAGNRCVLAKEKGRRGGRQWEEIEQKEQGLLARTIAVDTNSGSNTKDIVHQKKKRINNDKKTERRIVPHTKRRVETKAEDLAHIGHR